MQKPDRVMLRARAPEDRTPTGMLIPCSPGWFRAVGEGFDGGVFIGCGEDADGRVVITALLACPGARLSTAALRALPLGRLEAVLQGPELRTWAIGTSPPEAPAALQTYLIDSAAEPSASVPQGARQWSVTFKPGRDTTDPSLADWLVAQQPEQPLRERDPLTRPGSRLSEPFLRDVAERYRELAEQTHRPTLELAQTAGVPLPTARRWVSAARAHGYLGPGHKGRANP